MASNEDFKIYSETRQTTTMVQEINLQEIDMRLISKKEKIVVEHQGSEEKPKTTIIRHTRSITDTDPDFDPDPDITREVTIQETLTEGRSDQVTETKMTPEELVDFELEWRDLWKPFGGHNPQFE